MASKVQLFSYCPDEQPVLLAGLYDPIIDTLGNVLYEPMTPDTVDAILLTHKKAIQNSFDPTDFDVVGNIKDLPVNPRCLLPELIDSENTFANTNIKPFQYNFICLPHSDESFYPGGEDNIPPAEGTYRTELLIQRNNGRPDEFVVIPSRCYTGISYARIQVADNGVALIGFCYRKEIALNGSVNVFPMTPDLINKIEIKLFDNNNQLIDEREVPTTCVLATVNNSKEIFTGQSQLAFPYNFIYMYPDSTDIFKVKQRYFAKVNIAWDTNKQCLINWRFQVGQ